MKIEILSSALEDLHEGRKFYEKQGEGLGEYFFNALFAGIHPKVPDLSGSPWHTRAQKLLQKRTMLSFLSGIGNILWSGNQDLAYKHTWTEHFY